MGPKLKALMVSLGIALVGVMAGREMWAPAEGVTNAELIDAGIANCPVRAVRCLVANPQGRRVTREGKLRVCGTDDVVFSRAVRDAIQEGWTIIGCRNLGAATGGEAEMADVAHECGCQVDAGNCTAQLRLVDGGLSTAQALPKWTLAGEGYQWVNPSAACFKTSCNEGSAGSEWPESCPKQ